MYKVSILVPIYGVEQFIERCARSLFEQTYQNLEYVFVNDCTPDKSIEILTRIIEYYPKRFNSIRIISHEKNRGIAASRNTAYDNATGEFVTIVDSDDWLELNAIELLIKKQEATDADIVSGNALMYYDDRVEKLEHPINLSKDEIIITMLGNGWHNVIWGRLIRRSIIEDNHVRALEGCDMAEDKYQMAQISFFADSFAVCQDIVYNYERRNNLSIVAQKSKDKLVKKGIQFLQNNIGLQSFFADKEPVFRDEAAKQTMLYAYAILKLVVKFSRKEYFSFVVKTIDNTDSKYWFLIGWSTIGMKGVLMHNYYSMWIKLTLSRVLCFIKRKVKDAK